MSERDALEWLKHDDYRQIAELCEKTPKSAAEIRKQTGLNPRNCGEYLDRLERAGAITFTEKGWVITELAIEVLKKYFR